MKSSVRNRSGARKITKPTPELPKKHIAAAGFVLLFLAVVAPFTPSGDVSAHRDPELPLPAIQSEPLPDPLLAATIGSQSSAPGNEDSVPLASSMTTEATAEDRADEFTWAFYQVCPGDNLSKLMTRAGFSDREAFLASEIPDNTLVQLFPGQMLGFATKADGQLAEIRHKLSALESMRYIQEDGNFTAERETRQPTARIVEKSVVINSSLFLAGQASGLSDNLIMELANLFAGVIDFVLDPRQGDRLNVIYEALYLDEQYYSDGDIIAAAFTNKGETFSAYRYVDSEGRISYFNERGESMRKAFLMAPLDFTRISSNFNPRRVHPVYKTSRPHRGTDYAAPTGTPVFAAGDGRVIEAAYNRANGNYVFIQHGERYMTKYLHLHRLSVKQGQRVSQSQIIGTVGATGTATGPHLHYEFLVNGVHQNPRTIHKNLPKAKSLSPTEMPRFLAQVRPQKAELAQLIAQQEAQRLAQLDTSE